MMAGIRGKNTQPELAIRKALHALGFRYRIHNKRLPGKPDMTFPRYGAVIEINGCFWHRHNCHLFKWPSTRKVFWQKKISGNRERDIRNHEALGKRGWRILTIWECALKGRTKRPFKDVVNKASDWLVSGKSDKEIEGIKKSSRADAE